MVELPREIDALTNLFRLIFDESERGVVVACSAYLENQIKTDIFPNAGRIPFDTLLKVLAEFVVQKELCEILNILREIRNEAAHSFEPFKLESFGQTFSNNFVGKTQKLKIYSAVAELPVNIPNEGPWKIRELDTAPLLRGKISKDSMNFVLVSITLSRYIDMASRWKVDLGSNSIPKFE